MNNDNQLQNQQQTQYSKKKKYWLIPVLIFATMIISKVIQGILFTLEFESDFINTLFSTIFYICGFAVIPSIILVIILSVKNK